LSSNWAKNIFNLKSNWSKLVYSRRSTILSLPSQLVFPCHGLKSISNLISVAEGWAKLSSMSLTFYTRKLLAQAK
jgi:hypothetical protein